MEHDVTSLKDHVQILRRRWRVLVIAVLLGVAAGLGLSLQQQTLYAAETQMLVNAEPSSDGDTSVSAEEAATQSKVVASVGVAEQVVEELDLDESPRELLETIRVEPLEEAGVVAIRAERPSAEEAADVANAFVAEYVDFRAEQSAGQVEDNQQTLINQLSNVRAQITTVEEKINGDPSQEQLESLQAQLEALRIREADLSVQLMVSPDESPVYDAGEVLIPAETPAQPSQPREVRAAVLGGLLGLIVGTLFAYARDRFDDGIRDEARLKSAVGSIPILGRLPEEPDKTTRPIALTSPRSASSEAYRTLTTNIRFLSAAHATEQRARGEMLVVTSAVTGEGKTTVATNIAVTAARVGLKVLLVDADLRYPNVHERFGIETPVGLTHLLADQGSFDDALTRVDVGVGELGLIGAGAVPPNPAELLAGPRAALVWEQLRGMADLVVVDTAPVLGVADTLEISRQADLTLLVSRYRASRVHHMQSTIERVRQVGGAVDGVVWAAIPGKVTVYGYTSGRAAEKVAVTSS